MARIRPRVFKKGGKQRCGRGFSREELKKVGLCLKEALRLDISVDQKRRTAHEQNVEILKSFLESKKTVSKPKGKPKS
jgi:ribosomal protein L13E